MRVLFLLEAVSLSHVVRPYQLAKGLEAAEVVFASTMFPEFMQPHFKNFTCHKLNNGVTPEQFMQGLYRGGLVYTEEIIEKYIQEDLTAIEKYQPDVVVSDFRVSALISCHIAKKPLVSLSNVVWSPYIKQKLIAPESNITKIIGGTIGTFAFKNLSSVFFDKILRPMNIVRKRYELSPLKNLYEMYSEGDQVFYLDTAELVDMNTLPAHHKFIGPVLFSTRTDEPTWLDEYKNTKNRVLVALGSSGDVRKLKQIAKALEDFPGKVVIATSNRNIPDINNKNIIIEDFVDLDLILPHTDVFIGNGGSPGNYHAMSYGVPALMLPFNLDQYLCSEKIEYYGAGMVLRSGGLKASAVKAAVVRLIEYKSYRFWALKLKSNMSSYNSQTNFKNSILQLKSQKWA